jgi:hypothetical protein
VAAAPEVGRFAVGCRAPGWCGSLECGQRREPARPPLACLRPPRAGTRPRPPGPSAARSRRPRARRSWMGGRRARRRPARASHAPAWRGRVAKAKGEVGQAVGPVAGIGGKRLPLVLDRVERAGPIRFPSASESPRSTRRAGFSASARAPGVRPVRLAVERPQLVARLARVRVRPEPARRSAAMLDRRRRGRRRSGSVPASGGARGGRRCRGPRRAPRGSDRRWSGRTGIGRGVARRERRGQGGRNRQRTTYTLSLPKPQELVRRPQRGQPLGQCRSFANCAILPSTGRYWFEIQRRRHDEKES